MTTTADYDDAADDDDDDDRSQLAPTTTAATTTAATTTPATTPTTTTTLTTTTTPGDGGTTYCCRERAAKLLLSACGLPRTHVVPISTVHHASGGMTSVRRSRLRARAQLALLRLVVAATAVTRQVKPRLTGLGKEVHETCTRTFRRNTRRWRGWPLRTWLRFKRRRAACVKASRLPSRRASMQTLAGRGQRLQQRHGRRPSQAAAPQLSKPSGWALGLGSRDDNGCRQTITTTQLTTTTTTDGANDDGGDNDRGGDDADDDHDDEDDDNDPGRRWDYALLQQAWCETAVPSFLSTAHARRAHFVRSTTPLSE